MTKPSVTQPVGLIPVFARSMTWSNLGKVVPGQLVPAAEWNAMTASRRRLYLDTGRIRLEAR